MLLVISQLSRDVIGYEVINNWCISIRLLSQLNGHLLSSIVSLVTELDDLAGGE